MTWILVRVGEIWLKSEKTKKALMKRLVTDIRQRLSKSGVEFKIEKHWSRLLIWVPNTKWTQARDILTKIFGIVSISPGKKVKNDIKEIEKAVLAEFEGFSGRFAIKVNRGWKGFPMTSVQLAAHLSRRIQEVRGESLKVDLKTPEKVVFVDIREKFTFVYSEVFEGPGGLPYGCQGKALALFSGGIDSPVASWLVARRGLSLDFLFINFYGPILESKIYSVFEKMLEWLPDAKLYSIRLPELREEIVAKVPEGYRQVVYKRYMYRIAEAFARQVGAKALITGESLGQVSTQTLNNLITIQSAVSIPVFRPLIGWDKDETVSLAKKIGTFDFSSRVPEFCKLESHSRTNVPEKLARKFEESIDLDIENAVSRAREVRKMTIPDLAPNSDVLSRLEIVKVWEGEPIYSKDKKYLIICKSGLAAEERAYSLRKKGIEAYALSKRDYDRIQRKA